MQLMLSCTHAIAFVGTPHCGGDLANWASVLSQLSNLAKRTNKAIIQVLAPDSEVLARIQQEFHTMLRARANEDGTAVPKMTCFFEELPVMGVGEVRRVPHQKIGSSTPNLF